MTAVADALTWSGSGADVSLFVAVAKGETAEVDVSTADARPEWVRSYLMQDDDNAYSGSIVEIDAHFDVLPADLKGYLGAILTKAVEAGARVAWLGFEGSFHFDDLLTDDIATAVYGVAVPGSKPSVALSAAELKSPQWRAILQGARALL